jgi:hypothetical protein
MSKIDKNQEFMTRFSTIKLIVTLVIAIYYKNKILHCSMLQNGRHYAGKAKHK